jgi:hypothetical protein
LKNIAMTSKMKFSRLGLLVMTLAQTSCMSVSSVPPGSLYPPDGILRLKAGECHTATKDEVWHSAARYAICERDAENAAAALKQRDNRP